MGPAKRLTPEEEARCVHFLRLLNITNPNDRFLSDRGYFSLYLSGLHPEEVGEEVHPNQRDFREIIRLLSLAGVDQIRAILEKRQKLREAREAGLGGKTPAPISGGKTPAFGTPVPTRATTAPRSQPVTVSAVRTKPLGKPVAAPPSTFISGRTPLPIGAKRTPMPSNATPPPLTPVPVTSLPQSPPGGVKVAELVIPARTHYSKDIHPIRPSDAQLQHMRELQHAATEKEATDLANDYVLMGEFQDAYHVLVDYMISHPLTINLARAISQIITRANHYDLNTARPPYN
ncbi:MAG: hypothetical protein ABI579_08260, partial [Candidatus Sumerlaeota bacterium]